MSSSEPRPAIRGYRRLRQGRVSLPGQVYLVTVVVSDRQALFADHHRACAVARTFASQALLGESQMLAWVLMPDHAHMLMQLGDGETLSSVVGKRKSASARAVNQLRRRNGMLWQSGFHDRALRREEDLRAAARYLLANPIRTGLVESVGDYPYCNAIWLDGG